MMTRLAFGRKDEMRVEIARESMDAPLISVTSRYGGHTASVLHLRVFQLLRPVKAE